MCPRCRGAKWNAGAAIKTACWWCSSTDLCGGCEECGLRLCPACVSKIGSPPALFKPGEELKRESVLPPPQLNADEAQDLEQKDIL